MDIPRKVLHNAGIHGEHALPGRRSLLNHEFWIPSFWASAAIMSNQERVAGDSLRFRWWGFLVLGIALFIGGVAAILVPAVSTSATSMVLGAALVLVGIVKLVQAFETKQWPGFVWQLLGGGVEVVGGILVYFNPLKGAVAITLLIAIIFIVLGISQIGCALKVRGQRGWLWLFGSGLLALAMSLVLAFKFPHVREFEAGSIAGISLLVSGLAYAAIAFAVRKAQR